MPKRKKEDSESDYSYQEDKVSGDDELEPVYVKEDAIEEHDGEDDVVPDKKQKPKRQKPKAAEEHSGNDIVSGKKQSTNTTARQTDNGGYAHTLDSKMKISKANRGNTPWNKVRQRTLFARDTADAGDLPVQAWIISHAFML